MGWNEGFLSRRLVAVPDPMGLDEIECFDKPINQRSVIMRAARLHGIGDIRVADEPAPTSAAEQTLVRVTAVGICGSDLHWWDEGAIGDAKLTHPLVLGHEGAGVIAHGPRRGERVAIDPAIPCQGCRACRDGYVP